MIYIYHMANGDRIEAEELVNGKVLWRSITGPNRDVLEATYKQRTSDECHFEYTERAVRLELLE